VRPVGRGIVIYLVIIMVTGATIATPVSGKAKPQGSSPVTPSHITTSRPQRMDFMRKVRWSGVVVPRSDVKVLALVSGRIISQRAEDGAYVRRGDVLFTMGGPTIEARLKALGEKKRLMEKRVVIAEKDISVKREAVRQKMIRGAEERAAEDSLNLLKAELADIKEADAYLRRGLKVRSPVGGVFTGRRVSRGQFVERDALLGEVISTGALRLRASVFLRERGNLKGKKALIKQRGVVVAEGVVTRVLPRITKDGATVIWIEGPGIDAAFKPGEPVGGEVIVAVHRDALSLPADAVVRDDLERPFVFVKKGKDYEKRAVKTGIESAGRVEIIAGVSEVDDVVTSGAFELFYQDFGSLFKVAD